MRVVVSPEIGNGRCFHGLSPARAKDEVYDEAPARLRTLSIGAGRAPMTLRYSSALVGLR